MVASCGRWRWSSSCLQLLGRFDKRQSPSNPRSQQLKHPQDHHNHCRGILHQCHPTKQWSWRPSDGNRETRWNQRRLIPNMYIRFERSTETRLGGSLQGVSESHSTELIDSKLYLFFIIFFKYLNFLSEKRKRRSCVEQIYTNFKFSWL